MSAVNQVLNLNLTNIATGIEVTNLEAECSDISQDRINVLGLNLTNVAIGARFIQKKKKPYSLINNLEVK